MTPLLLAIAIVVLLLALELVLEVGKQVVVTTRQGVSIRGTRQLTLKPAIALGNAEILDGGSELQGRVDVPFRNVAIVQRQLAPKSRRPEPETPATVVRPRRGVKP